MKYINPNGLLGTDPVWGCGDDPCPGIFTFKGASVATRVGTENTHTPVFVLIVLIHII